MNEKPDTRVQVILNDKDIAQFNHVVERTGLSRSAAGAMLIRFGLAAFLSSAAPLREYDAQPELADIDA